MTNEEIKEHNISNVLEAATRLFIQSGVDNTSIEAIAEEAGVARRSVLNYFSSKNELAKAVFDRMQRDYYLMLSDHVAEDAYQKLSGLEQTLDLIRYILGRAESEYRSINCMAELESILRRAEITEHEHGTDRVRQRISAALRKGLEDGSVRLESARNPSLPMSMAFTIRGLHRMLADMLSAGTAHALEQYHSLVNDYVLTVSNLLHDLREVGDVPARREKLLVVDDEPVNRRMLRKTFADYYDVLEAQDGVEALLILRDRPDIQAVLLDLNMPRLDGFGVLDRMYGDPELSGIPVVVVTAYGDERNQRMALHLGALDVIQKPYDGQVILQRVRNIVQQQKAAELREQNRSYRELIYRSRMDKKAAVYNKEAFCERVAAILNDDVAGNYVLCRWDIDRFKAYNDLFGMDAGDALLARIGEFYRTQEGELTAVFGYLSADHFVAMYSDDGFDPNIAVTRIQDFLNSEDVDFQFVPRMGVFRIEDRELDVSIMCDRAFLALRSIKGDYARRIAWYDPSMRKTMLDEQSIIKDMSGALEGEQFVVYLQPQYNYVTGALHGAEALVRWKQADGTVVLPGRFIPLMEKNGMIGRLDEYVWDKVCAMQRRWLDEGIDVVPVSVNVSRTDVSSMDICDVLSRLTDKYGLEPRYLRLEITESAYVEKKSRLMSALNELRQRGFKIEMDDFGSGYSSLNTLKDAPVDTLKLDMNFLENDDGGSRSGKILSSVVRMASWIDLPVIAEGVERRDQADYLKSLGCVLMQGFLFARPMPEDQFREILTGALPETKPAEVGPGVEGAVDFLSASNQATLIFNSFVGGAVIVEYDGDHVEILRVNDRFFVTIDRSREEFAPYLLNPQERLCPSSWKMLLSTLQKAVDTGEEQQCELQTIPLDGEHTGKWLSLRARYLTKNGGRYILYLSIENVTEQMLFDETLRIEREKAELALSNVSLMIWEYDIPAAAFHRLGSYEKNALRDDVYGVPESLINSGDVADCSAEDYRRLHRDVAEGAKSASGDIYLRLADGSFAWRRLSYRTVFSNGRAVSAIGTSMDINAETEAKAKQKELELALNASSLLYWTYDLSTRAMSMPEERAAALGLPPVIIDAPSLAPGMFGSAEDRENYADFFARIHRGEKNGECSVQLAPVNGVTQWQHLSFLAQNDETGNDTVIITTKDVTKEHQKLIEDEQNRLLLEDLGVCTIDYDVKNDTLHFKTIRRGEGLIKRTLDNFSETIKSSTAIAPEDREKLIGLIYEAKKGPINGTEEYRTDIWGSGYHWSALTYSSLVDSSDNVYRIVGQIKDIQHEKERSTLMGELMRHIRSERAAQVDFDAVIHRRVAQELLDATDEDAVLPNVLKVMGEYCGADRACIFESTADGRYVSGTYEWHRSGMSPIIQDMQYLPSESLIEDTAGAGFDSRGVYVCRDIGALNPAMAAWETRIRNMGARAVLLCAMQGGKDTRGFLGLADCSGNSVWTERSVNTIGLTAKAVASFMMKKQSREAAALSVDFISAIDNSSLFIYITDPNTHRILYRNLALQNEFGKKSGDLVCYYEIVGCDEPCSECPMKKRDQQGRYRPVEVRRRDGRWILAQASPIRWKGKDVYMITCTDITANKLAEEALRVSAEESAIIIRQSGKQAFRYDIATGEAVGMTGASKGAASQLGKGDFAENMVRAGKILPADVEGFLKFFREIRNGKSEGGSDSRVRTRDGWRWFHADYSVISDMNGKPSYAVISYFDNTEQHERDMAYQESKARVRALLSKGWPYIEANLTTGFIDQAENIQLDQKSALGRTWAAYTAYAEKSLVVPEDTEKYMVFFDRERLLNRFYAGETDGQLEYRAKIDGAIRWFRAEIQMIRAPYSEDVKAFVLHADINREHAERERLAASASQDPLTGLLNRIALRKQANALLKAASPADRFAVLMIDLDNFKTVNDALGHQKGDDTLLRVADIMRETFRDNDLLCRLGGDEFMVFMTGTMKPADVAKRARALLDALQFSIGSIFVSASIGAAMPDGPGSDFDTLYNRADQAMYKAKNSGKNAIAFWGEDGDGLQAGYEEASADTVQLQVLLKHMDGGIIAGTVDGDRLEFTYLSPSLVGDLLHFDEHAAEEKRLPDLTLAVYPPDCEMIKTELVQAVQTKENFIISFRVGKTGTSWRQMRGEQLPDEGDGKLRFMCVVSDITEMKEAEAALRQNEVADKLKQYNTALASFYDEVYEINYERDTLKVLHSRFASRRDAGVELPLASAAHRWCSLIADKAEAKQYMDFVMSRDDKADGRAKTVRYTVDTPQRGRQTVNAVRLKLDDSNVIICNQVVE